MAPMMPNDPSSPWMQATPSVIKLIRKLTSGNQYYEAHEGVNTALNQVYFVKILEKLPNGMLKITNPPEPGQKKKVKQVDAVVEPDLIYPLIRGRDVKKWYVGFEDRYIILPIDSRGDPISHDKMKTKYPNTYDYFFRFFKELISRSGEPYKSKLEPYRKLPFEKAEKHHPVRITIMLSIRFSNTGPLSVIAGPCAIEGRQQTLEAAAALKEIFLQAGVPLIFKSSFDKANRSSGASYRGVGMTEGLSILAEVRERYDVPVITDIHLPEQAIPVAEAVDMLQIPAFLCRQTDLLLAAAATGKPVNIKKGQFLSPWEMRHVLAKACSTGNERICLCERGSSFGYNNLVVDMRGLEIMKKTGHPVIFDATHSVQLPGAGDGKSGGQREFVAPLARAAVAVGVAGLFLETHPDPDVAPCDGPNMLPFTALPSLLATLKDLDRIAKAGMAKMDKEVTVCVL